MLCSKLHCQKGFNLIVFSYQIPEFLTGHFVFARPCRPRPPSSPRTSIAARGGIPRFQIPPSPNPKPPTPNPNPQPPAPNPQPPTPNPSTPNPNRTDNPANDAQLRPQYLSTVGDDNQVVDFLLDLLVLPGGTNAPGIYQAPPPIFFFFSITFGLELSDTKVYEP